MPLSPGSRLGPYGILSPLGAGGMGEVYRARDMKLDRDVALKVLPEEFFEDRERRERFEREAKLLAAVSHPNIAAVYSFEEVSGRFLLVQEFLEGESLRETISRGPLPLKKALDVAFQMAEGLAAAHGKGIVHRDVKPENVLLTKDGHAKLLDFGLARHDISPHDPADTRSPTVDALSQRGVVLGTVAYMSPEQARGETVDFRTDQFSLGVVLYEMLSGRKPFKGASAPETLTAIIRDEPEPLEKAAPPNVPAQVRWIVERCLSKDPTERYDSTRDLAREISTCRSHLLETRASFSAPVVPGTIRSQRLIALGVVAAVVTVALAAVLLSRQKKTLTRGEAGSQSGSPARIVVLPFENLGSPEDGYFAAGITEEITSRLASIRSLAVISRTTATQYDRKGKTVEQIGKDLGVGYVLEGSVRWDKSGGGPGRVRITPQLIRVSDDTHLWTDRYDRQLSDIFAIQGDVADGVVRALNLTLAPSETAALRHVPTRDLDAYDLYLRAFELEKRRQEPSAIAEQIRLAGAAIERDPEFAEALALLARARLINYWLYYDRRDSEMERGWVEAERAVALRPDSAATHLALGYYYYGWRLDYEAALAEFGKALELKPNEAKVHEFIGYVKRRQGKMEEAEAKLRKAISGDPRNGTIYYNLGETQLLSHKYPEAIRNLEISTSLNSKYGVGHTYQAWAHLLWHGDIAAAKRVLQRAAGIHDLEDADGSLDYFSLRTALLGREWKKALEIVDKPQPAVLSPGLQFQYFPRPLLRAEALSYAGRRDLAQASYQEARRILVAKVSEAPEDAHFHSSLGIALAGLRQTAEALREGERGVELMPPEREAYRGVLRVEDLALIQTMVGNQDAAIKNLDLLLARPSWVSVPLLKLDPRWDPLRKNPKFEALLAKYEDRT